MSINWQFGPLSSLALTGLYTQVGPLALLWFLHLLAFFWASLQPGEVTSWLIWRPKLQHAPGSLTAVESAAMPLITASTI